MENFYLTNHKTSVQNIANLFLDETRKDVTFVFKGSDEKITAHKNILEASSPVFQSMFSGNFAEENEVKIDDISPEVFKLLLSGIYLNNIESEAEKSANSMRTYADLYYAAEKYDIKDIRELSKKYMLNNCHEGNTNMLLAKAKLFNLPDLEATCKDYFQKNTYKVLAYHISLNLNEYVYFDEFYDLENLAVKTEFDLYMAIQAMVDNKILKSPLKLLSKIRFLTMETTDVLGCKLISHKNKIAVISNIEAKKLRETPRFAIPAHLSVENRPRRFSFVDENARRFFWTAIMVKSAKYEEYYEDFFKQMKIPTDSKERTKALINAGRNEKDERGRVSYGVVHKISGKIFS